MARIRSIKPEFWDSPSTAKAGPWARLLYLAMWNWADDWGIGDATASRLRAFAFPHDEVSASDYPQLVAEVQNAYGVVFFEHAGRRFYVIPTFGTHQRTEKKAKPREDLIAAAEEACNDGKYEPELPLASESPRQVSDVPTPEVGSRNGGSRNGGTGEVVRARTRDTSDELPPVFVEFCDAWPGTVKTKPAQAAWTAAVKRTNGNPRRIINAALAYAEWFDIQGLEPRFMRDAVKWLNDDGWLDELKTPTRASPPTRANEHMQLANRLAAQEQQGPKEIAQ